MAAKHFRTLLLISWLLPFATTSIYPAEIFDAIRSDDPNLLTAVVRESTNLDVRDDRGRTPLMLATIKGNAAMVKLLLEKGANRGVADRDGRTAQEIARELKLPDVLALFDAATVAEQPDAALFAAVKAQDTGAVRAALDRGANVNVKGANYVTPLLLAARGDIAVLKLLIERGARPNAIDASGQSVFDSVRLAQDSDVRANLLIVTKAGEDEDSALSDADINAKTINRALARAVEDNDEDITIAMLKKGADPDHFGRSQNGLMWAASNGNAAIVRTLLKSGATVDAKTVVGDHEENLGKTALFYAAANGRTEIVELLLAGKANPNSATPGGLTPLMAAVRSKGTPQIVSALMKAGADVNAKRQDGRTALSDAISAGARPEIIQLLTEGGANAKEGDAQEALMIAAKSGQAETVQRILSAAKADKQTLNRALLAASAFGTPEVAKALLDNGADANTADTSGRSAVGLAAFSGRNGIVAILVKAGAKNVPPGFDPKTGAALPPPDSKGMTRTKWRGMVGPYDATSQFFGRVLLEHAVFEQKFGVPEKTQRVGDEIYWYYRCSDGLLQVVIDASFDKVLIKQINEY